MSAVLRATVACALLAAYTPLPGSHAHASLEQLPAANADALPRGRVIEKVVCGADAAQSYAVYLPSRYSRDRQWPLLVALDPRARGALPVQRFADAAEQYGYIVVGSNNSRNASLKSSDESLRAILADVPSRFSVDPARLYLAGFSGGARVAVLAAMGLDPRVAGVIGCGAGFPNGTSPGASTRFAYAGVVGIDDFNFPEMKDLDRSLAKLGVPHRLEVFDGAHDWPPADACARAVGWLELQGMRSKIRPMDESLLEEIAATAEAGAAAEEKAGRLPQALRRYSALAADFAGLRDVAGYERKAAQLGTLPDVRRALSEEAGSVDRQRRNDAEVQRLVYQALTGDERPYAVSELLSLLASLQRQSDRPANDAARMAARRVLASTWVGLNEAATSELAAGKFTQAAERLALMAAMRPADARVEYSLARARAREGRKAAAVEALQRAVKKGFADRSAIESERDFDALRGEESFRKVVAALR